MARLSSQAISPGSGWNPAQRDTAPVNYGGMEVEESIVGRPALEKTLFIILFYVGGIDPSCIPTNTSVLTYAVCSYAAAPSLLTLLRPLLLHRYALPFTLLTPSLLTLRRFSDLFLLCYALLAPLRPLAGELINKKVVDIPPTAAPHLRSSPSHCSVAFRA